MLIGIDCASVDENTDIDWQMPNRASRLGLIRSRGHPTRGGYDGEDGCEGRPREACAATVHG